MNVPLFMSHSRIKQHEKDMCEKPQEPYTTVGCQDCRGRTHVEAVADDGCVGGNHQYEEDENLQRVSSDI